MGIRRLLVALYWTFSTVVAVIGSIFGFAAAIACIVFGWRLARAGWPDHLVTAFGGAAILIGVVIFFLALPGITPGLRGGHPGDARTARLRDVRRSGIYRRR